MDIDYKVIGKRIQGVRKSCRITQDALAEQLDVSVGYVSQIERGYTKPNLSMLAEIASLLSCDLSYLVTGIVRSEKSYQTEAYTEVFDKLTDKEKNIVLSLMESLLKNR